MNILKKHQLKNPSDYTHISSDFVLDFYEKSKKAKGDQREKLLNLAKYFSEYLNDYVLKSYLSKKMINN